MLPLKSLLFDHLLVPLESPDHAFLENHVVIIAVAVVVIVVAIVVAVVVTVSRGICFFEL